MVKCLPTTAEDVGFSRLCQASLLTQLSRVSGEGSRTGRVLFIHHYVCISFLQAGAAPDLSAGSAGRELGGIGQRLYIQVSLAGESIVG